MIEVTRIGNTQTRLHGICKKCYCQVRVSIEDTKELVDRDTTEASAKRYVKCPWEGCDNDYLWVK